ADATLAREHAAHARNLARAGVDAILIETMNSAREAEAALRAAGEAGCPALVSFVCGANARLLSGEPLAEAIARVAPLAPRAVGVNCAPWSDLAGCLPALRACGLPFLAYGNLGAPLASGGRSHDLSAEGFAEHAMRWVASGARWVGGCCGSEPRHIAALARKLRNTRTREAGRSAAG
ncbi:MAG TPA: homocysteine S-methyltransferase family protein, partial [Myxococcota bacterium]|nr:homocysteine S-methyltransferase family protein [Myxococcota bacterium]